MTSVAVSLSSTVELSRILAPEDAEESTVMVPKSVAGRQWRASTALSAVALLLIPFSCLTAQVETTWVRSWQRPSGYYDVSGTGVAFDSALNVLVTGTRQQDTYSTPYPVVLRYSADGMLTDTVFAGVGGRGIAVGRGGRIFVTGSSVAQIDSELNVVWVRHPLGDSCDLGAGIRVTVAGDVVVAGTVHTGGSTFWDCVVAQYRPNGNPVWEETYSSPGAEYDGFSCVAIDGAGNVYAGGYLSAPPNNQNMLVMKYDSAGNQKWAWTVSTGDNHQDAVIGIAPDGYGGAYFTAQGDGMGTSLFLGRIGSEGETLWTRRVTEGQSEAVAVDSAGYVYVVGESVVGSTSSKVIVLKYDSLGEQKWVRTMEKTDRYWDDATKIGVTGSGTLIVAGYLNYPFQRGMVAQYTLGGDLLGRFVYDGDDFIPLSMTIGPSFGIAVTGITDYLTSWSLITMNCTCTPGVMEGKTNLPSPSLSVRPSPSVDVVDVVLTDQAVRAICVYNASGLLVRSLPVPARRGAQTVVRWDGRDKQGRSVPAGPYYLRTMGTNRPRTARAILVR